MPLDSTSNRSAADSSRHGHTTSSEQPSYTSRQFQERCLSTAEGFSENILSIMDGLGEEFYQMADQAEDHEMRRLYFTALQKLYSRRQQLKGVFKKQFLAALKADIQQQADVTTASLFANATLTGVEQMTNTSHHHESASETSPTPTSNDSSNDDEHTIMARSLPKGSWIEFHSPGSASLKARFTWVNPATGVYLFVDRDGAKAPDKTPEALAAEFRSGSATLIQSAAQLARAASGGSTG